MFQIYISTQHSTKIVLIKCLLNKVFHSFTTTRIFSRRFVEKAWTTDSKICEKSLFCLEKRNCAKQFLQAVHNGFEQKIIAVFSRFPQSFPQPCRICRIPQFPHKNRLLKPKKEQNGSHTGFPQSVHTKSVVPPTSFLMRHSRKSQSPYSFSGFSTFSPKYNTTTSANSHMVLFCMWRDVPMSL